jgi:hypothetical protein
MTYFMRGKVFRLSAVMGDTMMAQVLFDGASPIRL